MSSAQFSKHQLMLVGLQQIRSRQGGRTQSGDFCRIIPDPNSPAGGDIELWVSTRIPWDPCDSLIVFRPEHGTIAGTGPHYILVNLCAPWIQLDIVVAHAPHSWDPRQHRGTQQDGIEVEDAETQAVKCWGHFSATLAKRPLPRCPLVLRADVNIEFSHAQTCYKGLGDHQAAKEATPYAGILQN